MINPHPDTRRPAAGWRLLALCFTLLPALAFGQATTSASQEGAKKSYSLPAGDAAATLKQFVEQSGEQIVYVVDSVRGVQTKAVSGQLSAREALDQMLAETGLHIVQDQKTGALTVTRNGKNDLRAAQTDSDRPASKVKVEDGVVKLDTFEVMGSKLLNMDKPRSRDDAQPYVIFDRQTIERTGATNLEDLLRTRLTMETTVSPESQQISSSRGTRSTINLRGLGPGQTLILVDGRRVPGSVNLGGALQPDINGIPLAAIERIEVLPTTASGIYGGGATGGVVNIVLRRDYAGGELRLTYANAFDTDVATRRVDFSAGFTIEGGKTNVLVAGSYADGNRLLVQDRDFQTWSRRNLLANNPSRKFGFPFVGATSNIRSSNGQNLTLKPQYGGGALNSTITYVPYNYAGPASDNGAGLIANAGQINIDPAPGQQFGGKRRNVISTPKIESITASIRRQFTSSLQAFVDAGLNRNTGYQTTSINNAADVYTLQPTAAGNPFNQPVNVAVPKTVDGIDWVVPSEERRLIGGLIAALPGEWQVGVDYGYSESRLQSTTPANQGDVLSLISSGTWNVFRDLNVYPVDWTPFLTTAPIQSPLTTSLRDAVIRASGPVWNLPGGRPSLSLLLEDRKETTGASQWMTNFRIMPERFQKVRSAYVELKVPVIGVENKIPFVREFELQLAGRRDDYTTNGSNTPLNSAPQVIYYVNELTSNDPTLAFRWVPVEDVAFRASYGTGFLPPNITQLSPTIFPGFLSLFSFVTDPKRGNAPLTGGDWLTGGNPYLKPELSKTWSAGIVLTPKRLAGLRLSVDWLRIEKTDNMATIDLSQVLANEDRFPGRVVRGPKLPGDPASWAGPITAIDASMVNIAQTESEAFDFQLDYRWESKTLGTFDFFAIGTRTVHFKTRLFPSNPLIERVGTSNNASTDFVATQGNYPLKIRGNVGVNWTRGRWTAGWITRYIDSYRIAGELDGGAITNQGNGGWIDSQTFHDVYCGYKFGPGLDSSAAGWRRTAAKLFQKTEIQVGVKNVLNEWPVWDASGNNYNGYTDPRLANYYITLKRSF